MRWAPWPTGPTVLRTDRPNHVDPLCSLVSDSKGMFDSQNNELPQDDKKSATETPIINEMPDACVADADGDPTTQILRMR